MTTATLSKRTFSWGASPTVSEVQFVINMAQSLELCRNMGAGAESATSCRQQEIN